MKFAALGNHLRLVNDSYVIPALKMSWDGLSASFSLWYHPLESVFCMKSLIHFFEVVFDITGDLNMLLHVLCNLLSLEWWLSQELYDLTVI